MTMNEGKQLHCSDPFLNQLLVAEPQLNNSNTNMENKDWYKKKKSLTQYRLQTPDDGPP